MLDENRLSFVLCRDEIIRRRLSNLNDRQFEAVIARGSPLLLLAGAGSGKTTMLINRIASLVTFGDAFGSDDIPDWVTDDDAAFLNEFLTSGCQGDAERAMRLCSLRPVKPWQIIAITFTNKAAGELKERLKAMLGDEGDEVWASTFHSACVRILRRDIDRLGFTSNFTIYDSSDSEHAIKDAINALGMDEKSFPAKSILSVISSCKDARVTPQMLADQNQNNWRMAKIAKVYELYVRRLKEANALDFDDIILHTVTLLENETDVREYYQNKFRHVLIDEYQDTNRLQNRLAELLSGKYRNICVVGDDDQSIYRFRGATIENILDFEKNHPDAQTILLEQNYRSTQSILNVANVIIKNNTGRHGKKLWTSAGVGAPVVVHTASSETDEADAIARDILDNYSKTHRWRDHTVLYRVNAMSNQVESAFKRHGIPYRIFGGLRFFDRAEVKDMLAYLWVILTPEDSLRLRRIINVPARKIGQKTVDTAAELADAQGLSVYHIIKNASQYADLVRSANALKSFTDMIDGLSAAADEISVSALYDRLLEESGYVAMLQAKKDPENEARLENIMELKTNILEYEQRTEDPSLWGFLDEVSLFTDIDRYDTDSDAVSLMTIHASKGLEFPNVYICGCEEGIFPSFRSVGNDEDIEEERRLFYVAVTRARNYLMILSARHRMLYGKTSYNHVSRFIDEIPDGYAERTADHSDEPKAGSFFSFDEDTATRKEPSRPVVTEKHSALFNERNRVASAKTPSVTFRTGDMVTHKTFGSGMVVSVKAMGGDALLEIAFDGVGTKRMMANTAAKYMTKQ